MIDSLRKFFYSFRYAGRGLWYCIANERNFRIHLSMAFYVVLLAFLYRLQPAERGILLLCIALVLSAEMVNTAAEILVDMFSPGYSGMAKVVKDVSAGSVLVFAIFAAAIGLGIFWRPSEIQRIFAFLAGHPGWLAALAAFIAADFFFVFTGPVKIGHAFRTAVKKCRR